MGMIEHALQTEDRLARIIGNVDHIATLPEVVMRITQVVNNPRSTAAELQKIISSDPALVSRILKLVNSSYYARSTEIDSVQRAIVLLGFEAVHNAAISATVGQLFRGPLTDDFSARDLWTHSVAVATLGREIAWRVCRPLAEQVFLAGLLHDIGLLVEFQVCPAKLRQVAELAGGQSARFSALELSIIGVDHSEIGAALAEKWGFPPACRAVAAYHHRPALAEPEFRQLAGIIHVADTLCCQDGLGFHLTAVNQMAEESGFAGFVPLEVIDFARDNLPQLVSDAVLAFA